MATKKSTAIAPPDHLTASSKAYWTSVQATFGIVDDTGLKLLQGACECLDTAEQARQTVAKNGQTFSDRLGNIRPHPSVKIARDAILAFKAICRELRLDPISTEQKR